MLPYGSADSRLYRPPPPPPTSTTTNLADPHQRRRYEALHSFRKHKSLDGPQFIQEFERGQPSSYPKYYTRDEFAEPPPQPAFYSPQPSLQPRYNLQDPLTINVPGMNEDYYRQPRDFSSLQREHTALSQRLNYVMNSIRTFWSPELKKERQLRKDEALRLNSLQNKICQQAAELQVIQSELEKREKDISQLLSESELLDMEEELRRLRRQLHEPRNYTEKSVSTHELHTLKTKMERSEMTLSEKMRELASAELRAKCAEEKNGELEKRLELLSKSNTTNEAQNQLLQDDLGVLRQKLETRNQQIEAKEKQIKKLEQHIDSMRNQISDSNHVMQDTEHRSAQLTHRIDQLETLLREREGEVERLKQRNLQQPGVRKEAELKLQLENAEQDIRKLQESIDVVRKSAEVDKQTQLKTFQEENKRQELTIDYLQKELSDRELLLASQNEKISELDNQLKLNNGFHQTPKSGHEVQRELEKAQNEVERLLRIVQMLEKEKATLNSKLNNGTQHKEDYECSTLDLKHRDGTKSGSLNRRIEELEEALRESVGITAERDKLIAEQKTLIQQMSGQLTDLFKEGGREKVLALNNIMMNKDFKNEIQKAMHEERSEYERQIATLRKEALLTQIREKEATIQMLQIAPDQYVDQISLLTRQRDQLKHKLLTCGAETNTSVANLVPHIPASATEMHLPPLNTAIASVKAGGPISAPSGNVWLNSTQQAFDNALRRVDFANSYGQGQDDNGDDDGIWA